MSGDYGTMTARVCDELTRYDLTAQAQNAIQSAIHFYENTPLWFNEEISTASTVNAQQYYALPSDFMRDRSLTCLVTVTAYPLKRRTHHTLDKWFINSTNFTGYPGDYSIYQQQIRLYPIPNGVYTLTLSYIKSLSALANDTDTNAWMVEGEELIRSRAQYDLCMRVLRKPDWAQLFRNLELDAYRNLKSTSLPYQLGAMPIKRSF